MSFFRTVTVDGSGGRAIAASSHAAACSARSKASLSRTSTIAATCEAVCAELEAGHHGLIRTDFPAKFAAFFYGINLNLTHPDLKDYFAEVPKFRDGLSRLLPGDLGLERR